MLISNSIKKQQLILDEKYKEYLNEGHIPKNSLYNPRNLFDDLTQKDQIWLRIARNHLSKLDSSNTVW